MTIALGLTDANGAPAGAVSTKSEHLAIVVAPLEQAGSAQARLALQVALAQRLGAFLPFKPNATLTLSEAQERVEEASIELTEQLNACRGKAQFTLVLTLEAQEVHDSRQSWLRRRAGTLDSLRKASAILTRELGQFGSLGLSFGRNSLSLHMICDVALESRVRTELTGMREHGVLSGLGRISLSLTGPWPVLFNPAEEALG